MRKLFSALLSLLALICLAACGSGAPLETPAPTPTVITLALAGDLVMHVPLHREAETETGYDYAPVFGEAASYIERADFSVCCLEAALMGDGRLMGYPLFHAPDELAYSLRELGFDLVNMASNHAYDGFYPGIVRTLDVLDAAGLDHVGAYRTQEERDYNNGVVVEAINGVTIAFLDYTYGTNGISIKENEYCVNVYYLDYMTCFNRLDYDKVSSDMAAARALDTDLIAVSVHWGAEYTTSPTTAQKSFADYLFSEGADIVLGGHPHVPQPMELRTVTDEDGGERTGFLCYCLGNLLSCQGEGYTDLAAIVELQITKDGGTGETEITGAGYIPMIMIDPRDYAIYDAPFGYRLWDLRAAIADYEAGDDRGLMTEDMYLRLQRKLRDARAVLGELELAEER